MDIHYRAYKNKCHSFQKCLWCLYHAPNLVGPEGGGSWILVKIPFPMQEASWLQHQWECKPSRYSGLSCPQYFNLKRSKSSTCGKFHTRFWGQVLRLLTLVSQWLILAAWQKQVQLNFVHEKESSIFFLFTHIMEKDSQWLNTFFKAFACTKKPCQINGLKGEGMLL